MEAIKQPPVYLYILMRTDLASMNPGKAVAQGTHAANQCVWEISQKMVAQMEQTPPSLQKDDDELAALLKEWEDESGKGFGTCICLGVTERQMRAKVETAQRLGLHAGITHDPTYPLQDGDSFHLIPLDTCGFVFGRKDMVMSVLMADLDLMK
jgi:peptidyl-tRNA hydrolase